MRAIGLIVGLTAGLACVAAERPTPVVILAEDAAYKAAKPAPVTVEGVLERTPSPGTLGGPSRFNPYRLILADGTGKTTTRELFVGSRAPLLAVHVGARVRVQGKLMEVETAGAKRLELWAARVEPMSAKLADAAGKDGVYARSTWQPSAAFQRGARFFVFRNGQEVGEAMKLTGATMSATATTELARQLHVPAIDWNKHMVVTISAGLHGPDADHLRVTRMVPEENTLTIFYKLEVKGAGPAAGFGYPAETVLVDRFAGTVRFSQDKPAPAPKKAN